jgi:tetratricopeptide (TPR) repeat protein
MSAEPIFISHASGDDAFVAQLRQTLEGQGLRVWVDSRNLRGGAKLAPEIASAIEQARQVLVVLSPETVNSAWMRKEIQQALQVEQRRKGDGYRVIPLLLPGIRPSALGNWFDEEPVAIPIELAPGHLNAALPDILAALGERLPADRQLSQAAEAQPIEELLLELRDIKIQQRKGTRRVAGIATLTYTPAAYPQAPMVESRRYNFSAPLGPIEAEDLRWYLESYYVWPVGVFKERADWIAAQLPKWGQALYQAALGATTARDALAAWQASAGAERRFSIKVDPDLPDGADAKQQAAANEAASTLLSLPWELLHDGRGYLFQGKHAARVRRRLPNRLAQPVVATKLPIRILLVSPRPEDERAGYIDHRASALPLVEAIENLGELVTLTVLTPPTFPALEAALVHAATAGTPFAVVHFDGHGVYDHEHGLGALCFEDPKDANKLQQRASQLIDAAQLAAMIRDRRVPLVFLEACQSAMIAEDPTASAAAKLLEEGVTSVVAMSHSVLVETARRFVQAFYAELARGARVGKAMLAGQQALYGDTFRLKIMGAGELRLQDWFVPVLYQEANDPQLIDRLPPSDVQQLEARTRALRLGALPPAPAHRFQGRSRELLALERLLHDQPYAVVRGQGGAGKTTLAAELARWLVRSGRFRRAAFASVEQSGDARTVLDSLGRQLLPEGQNWSVAQFKDLKEALQPIERALRDQPTLIVLDNLESVLPAFGVQSLAAAPVEELFDLAQTLLAADPATRILFTSRESLSTPFDNRQRAIELGALSQDDAVELVGQVMAQEGWTPPQSDAGETAAEIIDLVEAVNRHARALVLLAREVASQGVRATTDNQRALMAELERKHPGERENSLYASVELSLRRLPAGMREQIKGLAVFQGGAQLNVLADVLVLDIDTARSIAIALIDVGLAEDMGYAHLRLDPALPPYLLSQMSVDEQEQTRARWAAGMKQLANFLYKQRFKDTQLAAQLTLLELPNLLALLAGIQDKAPPEQIVVLASTVEQLLANLDRPQALAQTIQVREQAARALQGWSHARFEAERQSIERLLDRGEEQVAYSAADQLLQRCLNVGEAAYPDAAYDIAMAYNLVGQTLNAGGTAENALKYYAQAQQRFQILADQNNESAARMASLVISRSGDCLRALGRLDESVMNYEEAIRRDEGFGANRGLASTKAELGYVRVLQQRYTEALTIYAEARDIFESLGEPRSIAATWHQIGIVHKQMMQFEAAERAYRQSLAIEVQQKNLAGEAGSLKELGTLYRIIGRLEESATFHRQAANIYIKLQSLVNEGRTRHSLANTLFDLRRYDEARRELQRAIECKRPYGHAATPWTTWNLLHNLEQATGNPQAAADARQQTIQSYLAYRRDGGENQEPGAKLCAQVAQAIQQNDSTEAAQALAGYLGPDAKPWAKAMIPKLQAILHGSRDAALADDEALDYDDAAELLLLLERLG